jgi:iron complex transport system substrate-binding protein
MPRIVSLIASATEIVCALGFEKDLIGRSHECDFPESVKGLPVCTEPKFDVEGSSAQIDGRVKAVLQEGTSVYRVHADVLKELCPDVIITQSHCEVCAVSQRDVEESLQAWLGKRPVVVSLEPNCLVDVWHGIEDVAEALGVRQRGRELVGRLHQRIAGLVQHVQGHSVSRPTVACLEWLDPLMAAGNWMPELVSLAGGVDPFGKAGQHSPWMSFEELRHQDPEVIVALPCGLDLGRTRHEMAALTGKTGWSELRAVRTGRVFVTDGNQYFNRPGPRLVESLEILAEVMHGSASFCFGHRGRAWQGL